MRLIPASDIQLKRPPLPCLLVIRLLEYCCSDLGVAAMAWQGPSLCKRLPHTIVPPSSLVGVHVHVGMLRAPANMLHALLHPRSWGMPPQLAAAFAAKRHYTISSATAAAAVASAVGHIPVAEQASMVCDRHLRSLCSSTFSFHNCHGMWCRMTLYLGVSAHSAQ